MKTIQLIHICFHRMHIVTIDTPITYDYTMQCYFEKFGQKQ